MIRVHQCRLTKTVETLEKDDKKSVVKENLNLKHAIPECVSQQYNSS
jgi:hypothetical protein